MMKFIFFMLFLCFISVDLCFLLISNLLMILGLKFYCLNFTLVDFKEFGFGSFMDVLSYSLIVLSFWIIYLMYYSSASVLKTKNNVYYFSLCLIILMVVLTLTFLMKNLLAFYFFFEVSLIPTLLIITGWGYQPERLQAGVYFLFYTLTASLPLLLVLFFLSEKNYSVNIFKNFYWAELDYFSFYLFVGLTLAFLVKMPMFFTHLWLPKAHVEAPVAGSMILAGVLLKLGGYGFFRVLNMSLGGLKFYGGYFFGLSIMGMFYVGLICCRLNDLKALVAYSSVAHMGLVISGVYTLMIWGFSGSLMMMISHGLASSGLFCIVNMYYERSSSRSMFINRGLIMFYPVFSFMIFMLSAANMAAPPSINLMSEIFLMVSMLKFDKIMLFIFPLGSYLGVVFTLFMFSYSQHGKNFLSLYSYEVSTMREYNLLVFHIVPVNLYILKSEWIFLF